MHQHLKIITGVDESGKGSGKDLENDVPGGRVRITEISDLAGLLI